MQVVSGLEKRSICIGASASCGASSCQPGVLSVADALVCACTDRTVMNTCVNWPFGGMQLGGSLSETVIVAWPGVIIVLLPLQLTRNAKAARMEPPQNAAIAMCLIRARELFLISVSWE